MNLKICYALPNQSEDWFIELKNILDITLDIYYSLTNEQALFRYDKDKWTLKELLNHLIECEKIFNYRALCFTKNDKTKLPGFDEDLYVLKSNANEQSLILLIEEFKLTRINSLYFFGKLTEEELLRKGIANNNEQSVIDIAKHIAKHNQHHVNILKERYLPLL